MVFLAIAFLLICPLFIGLFIKTLLREKDMKGVEAYSLGFLSLFVFLFACVLVALKLDTSFTMLRTMYLSVITLFSVLGAIICLVKVVKRSFSFSYQSMKTAFKENVFILLLAFFVAVISFFLLAPSFLNDDTFEIVATTLATDKIYEYSSLTGNVMVAGLPIFNKIYVLPMFTSIMVSTFKISADAFAGIVMPLFVYSIMLMLAGQIAKSMQIKNIKCFYVFFLLLLIAGTYLPGNGVPVTIGFSVLREGYSGYAVAYGIAIPLFILELCKRNVLLSTLPACTLLTLLRLDRMAFALMSPLTTLKNINEAGKLLALCFVALIAYVATNFNSNKRIRLYCMLSPEIFIALIAGDLYEFLEQKKLQRAYIVGSCVVILSSCSFMPFSDACLKYEYNRQQKAVADCLSMIESDSCIWADEAFMATVRRISGKTRTIYGRDVYTSTLQGLSYEPRVEYVNDYYNGYNNLVLVNGFYPVERDMLEILLEARELVDYLILPVHNDNPKLISTLIESGFSLYDGNSEYMVFTSK